MTTPTSRAISVATNPDSSLSSQTTVSGEADVALTDDTTALLVLGCQHCLAQCNLLLNQISEGDYAAQSGSSSVGAHLRHILDRFQCFVQGLPSGQINYDARKRDHAIETSLEAAAFALAAIIKRMDSLQGSVLFPADVCVQETVYQQSPAVQIQSSLQRELMGLITHTTHHLAIIAIHLKSMGYTPDKDFGKAPSTIRFERLGQ